MQTLKIDTTKTVEGLFNAGIARAVMLDYWKKITKSLYLLNIDSSDLQQLLHSARKVLPRKRIGSVMQLICFIQLCQSLGVNGARLELGLKAMVSLAV